MRQAIIINPRIVVRCGYPLCVQDMIDQFSDKDKDAIDYLAKQFGLIQNCDYLCLDESLELIKLKKILGHARLKQRHYGGNERSLHFKECPELKYKEITVYSSRFVITGTRVPGGITYEGECDPPYLKNQKRHKIWWAGYALDQDNLEFLDSDLKFV